MIMSSIGRIVCALVATTFVVVPVFFDLPAPIGIPLAIAGFLAGCVMVAVDVHDRRNAGRD